MVRRLGLVVFGIVLGLAVMEVVLRALLGYYGSKEASYLFLHDDLLGWRFKPGAIGSYSGLEFRVDVQINSKGLRDGEYTYEKPPGTFRVLVLGDSMTEGFGVQQEETYAKQLEILLNEKTRQRMEVINAGIRGSSTDREFLFLSQEGVKYGPDLVLVAFIQGDQNNTPIAGYWGPRKYFKPFFRLKGTTLELHGIPVPTADTSAIRDDNLEPLKNIFRQLALYSWAQAQLNVSQIRPMFQAVGVMKASPDGTHNDPATRGDSGVYAYGQEAWRVERQLLHEMKMEVEQQGGKLMLVLAHGGISYASILGEISQDLGIQFFDLAHHPLFEEAAKNGALQFRYDMHWNPRGHRLAAEILSECLLSQARNAVADTRLIAR